MKAAGIQAKSLLSVARRRQKAKSLLSVARGRHEVHRKSARKSPAGGKKRAAEICNVTTKSTFKKLNRSGGLAKETDLPSFFQNGNGEKKVIQYVSPFLCKNNLE